MDLQCAAALIDPRADVFILIVTRNWVRLI